MPLTIKRYPNRKLYDTEAKQYITLEGVADLIRKGEEVHVVDYASGEDLTALTLSQIIFEQEKKPGGFLPRTLLAGLVQAGEETLETLGKALSSPREFWRQVDEEITRRVETLVNSNEIAREEGARLLEKLIALGKGTLGAPLNLEADIEKALTERGVPSREEIDRLKEQLDALLNSIGEPTNTPPTS
jgi:polyhydroxyalkanoate synthesis repressor PhaR